MSEWIEGKLQNICCKIGSGATPTGGENSYMASGISFIRSQNVLDYEFTSNGLAFINDEQAYGLRNVEVLENDILINITGESVTRCCIVPIRILPARVNQHVSIIRLRKESADYKYVFYFLQFIKPELNKIAEIGCTRRALTKQMLESIDIPLPPLPEQRAIAGVLSSLDDKIDLLRRENRTLEAMAETLFRQWFVEEADEGIDGKLSDLIEINPTRSLSKGSTAPYLEMANVNNSSFCPSDWYDREFSSGTKFRNGDTLLARITPCLENGKACYITFLSEDQTAWGSTEFIVMHPKDRYHPLLAYALAKNRDFRDYAESCLEGSTGRQRVNIGHLRDYPICFPNTEKVSEINSVLFSIEPKMHNNFLKIRTLENLRDTLLPKLMSGEVRVAAREVPDA